MDDTKPTEGSGWSTIDVQRTIGSGIIAVFGIILLALTVRIIISGLPADSLELLKQGINALINIVMVVVGFWFGSSKGSQDKSEAINKITLPPTPTTTTQTTRDGDVTTITEPTTEPKP